MTSETLIQACIDIATSYISWALTQDADPFTERICNTMVATIQSFPAPETYQPTQPRPDDSKSIADKRVFTDESMMRTLLVGLDATRLTELDHAADQMRARLPLLPACFKGWKPEKKLD